MSGANFPSLPSIAKVRGCFGITATKVIQSGAEPLSTIEAVKDGLPPLVPVN
jgi:hypothetical protein